jgi:hypothetical protein
MSQTGDVIDPPACRHGYVILLMEAVVSLARVEHQEERQKAANHCRLLERRKVIQVIWVPEPRKTRLLF